MKFLILLAALLSLPAFADEPIFDMAAPRLTDSRGHTLRTIPVTIKQTSPQSFEISPVIMPFNNEVLGEESNPFPSYMVTWSVNVTTPQVVSGSVGVIVGYVDGPGEDDTQNWMHLSHGVLLQAEPGIAGGKVAVGYALAVGDGSKHFTAIPIAGAALKGVLMRTWGPKVFVAPDDTYLGIELSLDLFVKITVGALKRMTGEDKHWIFSGGIGFGF